jgi:hypothetical protein
MSTRRPLLGKKHENTFPLHYVVVTYFLPHVTKVSGTSRYTHTDCFLLFQKKTHKFKKYFFCGQCPDFSSKHTHTQNAHRVNYTRQHCNCEP